MADVGCVVFDLDGILHDSAAGITAALNVVMDGDGLGPLSADAVKPFIGDNPDSIVPKAYKTQGFAFVPYEANPRQQSFREAMKARAIAADEVFAGVSETLTALRQRGMAIALCTNGFHDVTVATIERLGLTGLFDAIVCGQPQSPPKPDPAPIREAIATARAARQPEGKANLLIIGRKEDVKAGKSADCTVIAVRTGYGDGPIENWGALAVLDGVDAVPGWIDTAAA
ncbi:HAD hydrolase-like protein [Fodinicurvata sp. EGI_FJ10296]|uniref:HAD family hydrolase n=1 Tax=Fodinicurvata sp. EGI_FJ10296 TaxID=3231908 RepID=UPI00345331D4